MSAKSPPKQKNNGGKKKQFHTSQDVLMVSLQKFFSRPEHLNKMLPILNQETKISLRLLDWFVTNYTKKISTEYYIDNNLFNVFLSYKAQLKAYSKQNFDPFCRQDRIQFYYKKPTPGNNKTHIIQPIETTVGQLNFFRWAISNNVLNYVIDNLKKIEDDMIMVVKIKKLIKEKKLLQTYLKQRETPQHCLRSGLSVSKTETEEKIKTIDLKLDTLYKINHVSQASNFKKNGTSKQFYTPNNEAISRSKGKFQITFD